MKIVGRNTESVTVREFMRHLLLNLQNALCRSGKVGCRDVSVPLAYVLLQCGFWQCQAGTERLWQANVEPLHKCFTVLHYSYL
jgi:hypothetical protein